MPQHALCSIDLYVAFLAWLQASYQACLGTMRTANVLQMYRVGAISANHHLNLENHVGKVTDLFAWKQRKPSLRTAVHLCVSSLR